MIAIAGSSPTHRVSNAIVARSSVGPPYAKHRENHRTSVVIWIRIMTSGLSDEKVTWRDTEFGRISHLDD
jgi:hypothetical protein